MWQPRQGRVVATKTNRWDSPGFFSFWFVFFFALLNAGWKGKNEISPEQPKAPVFQPETTAWTQTMSCGFGWRWNWKRGPLEAVLAERGGVVLAADVSPDSGGAKSFVWWDSWERAIGGLQHLLCGSWYEVVPPGQAVKLYMDVDVKREQLGELVGEGGRVEEWREVVIAELESAVCHLMGLPAEHRGAMVFDASTAAKGSLHLVWPELVFESVQAVKWWMQRLLLPMLAPAVASVVDSGVYGRWQCWRLPLCSKLGRNNPLMPHQGLETAVVGGQWDVRRVLELGLVSNVGLGDVSVVMGGQAGQDQVEKVSGHWKRTSKDLEYVSGVWCPAAGRVHASNRAAIVDRFPDGGVRYMCLDPACGGFKWAERGGARRSEAERVLR